MHVRSSRGDVVSVQVVYEVGPRDRSDQIRRLEHRRAMENMERRRRNSQRIHRSPCRQEACFEVSSGYLSGFTLPRTRRLTLTVTRRRMRF